MIRSLLLLALVAGGCFRSPPSAEPPPRPVPTDPAMVLVKGGAFTQGSAGATGDDLGWPHQEVVPSFYADVTEVTVQAYQTCLQAGACSYPPLPEPNEEIAYRTSRKIAMGAALRSPRCNLERENAEYANDPVNCVTWQEAAAYCAWRGAELPTEAMWEYAAGGARGWAWPWNPADWERADHTRHLFLAQHGNCREAGSLDSSKLPRRAAYYRDTSCPVGSTPRGDSPDGIKDMEGNVSEWTRSNYCRRPGIDCKADARVVKGTSYEYLGGPWVGIQQRLSRPVAHWTSQIGFRCARLAGAGGAKGERSR